MIKNNENKILDDLTLEESQLCEQVEASLERGRVCLIPVDTLPGLSFYADSSLARDELLKIKGYKDERPFVSLVASLEKALQFWEPLPKNCALDLEQLWPGPLTVLWRGSTRAPKTLMGDTGKIAIRVPALPSELNWVTALLHKLRDPLASTSVNQRGQPAKTDWAAAADFAGQAGAVVPKLPKEDQKFGQASTIVELFEDGSYKVLRQGSLDPLMHKKVD